MPKIPTYEARVDLDTDRRGMPRVYVDTAAQDMEARMGARIAGIGNQISDMGFTLAAQQQKREEQTAAFKDGIEVDMMRARVTNEDQEAFQKMPEDGKGWAQARLENYDKVVGETMAKLSPQDRDKYAMRFQAQRAQYAGAVARQEFEQTAKWAQGVHNKTVDEYARIVTNDPAQLDTVLADAAERVKVMPVPEALKPGILRATREVLQASAAAREFRANPEAMSAAFGRVPEDIDPVSRGIPPSSGTAAAASMLRKFEGYRSTTYWDVNRDRVGYGSDTITRPDGTVVKVQKGMTVNREDAERDLARRTAILERQVSTDIGPDIWQKLTPTAQGAILSVAYNYGTLPRIVRTAATLSGGDPEKIAIAIESLKGHNEGVNANRRQQEANAVRSGAMPTGSMPAVNPRYADVSPQVQDRLLAQANRELRADNATVRSLVTNDIASIESTGIGVEGLTDDRVRRALGDGGLEDWKRKRALAEKVHTETLGFDSMTPEQLAHRIEKLTPTPGAPDFVEQKQAQDAVRQRADELIKRRAADPAAAVASMDNVRQAEAGARAAGTTAAREAMIAARLSAQTELGITGYEQRHLTRDEARRIAMSLRPMAQGQQEAMNQFDIADGLIDRLKDQYGQYAKQALQEVLAQITLKKNAADIIAAAAMKLEDEGEGGKGPLITRTDLSRAENEKRVQAVKSISAGIEPPAPSATTKREASEVLNGQRDPVVPVTQSVGDMQPGTQKHFSNALQLLYTNPQKLLPYFVMQYGVERVPSDLRQELYKIDQNFPGEYNRPTEKEGIGAGGRGGFGMRQGIN